MGIPSLHVHTIIPPPPHACGPYAPNSKPSRVLTSPTMVVLFSNLDTPLAHMGSCSTELLSAFDPIRAVVYSFLPDFPHFGKYEDTCGPHSQRFMPSRGRSYAIVHQGCTACDGGA